MRKTVFTATVCSVLLLTLGGCGNEAAETDQVSEDTAYPVTISNYTRPDASAKWETFEVTFDQAPKKVVANVRPAAELLLHLGLKDNIAGVGGVFGAADEEVSAEFDELNQLGNSYISKETALSVDPDLVFGRGGLFEDEDWGNGSVQSLSEMGMATYVMETSVAGSTFESVYNDIDNLGEIFNVPEQAQTFKEELQERQSKLEEKVKDIGEEKTFAYLHLSDPEEILVYAAHEESFFNDSFNMIKLTNVFQDETGEVSVETLIETDPDVLIVPDWSTYEGGVSGDEMVKSILSNSKLSGMKAVKNKEVYSVDYNYMFSYSYQTLTGMELLVDEVYPEK